MGTCRKGFISVGIVAMLVVCPAHIYAQGTSHMEGWTGLKETLADSSLKAVIRDQEALVSQNPGDADARNRLAKLYLAQRSVNRRGRAARVIREAIQLDANHAAYRVTYARVLRAQWKLSLCRTELEKALELDPQNVQALYLTGRLAQEEMLAEWDKKLTWIVDGGGTTPTWQKEGGLPTDVLGGYSPSRYEKVTVPVAFDSLTTITWRGFAEGAAQRAVKCFEQSIAIDPLFRPSYDRLGLVYVEAGRPQELRRLMTRYLLRQPDDRDGHLFCGLGHHLCGDHDRAFAEYQKALALMDENEARVMLSTDPLYSKNDRKTLKRVSKDSDAQESYSRQFWAERDPLFLTPYNERQLEHYGRVAYANLRFSLPEKGIPGWQTDMGKAFIRFGRYVQRETRGIRGNFPFDASYSMPTAEQGGSAGRGRRNPVMTTRAPLPEAGRQVWAYEGFDLTFENRDGTNQWTMPPISKEALEFEPDRYVDPYREVKYNLPVQIVGFKCEAGDSVDLEVAYLLPKDRLDSEKKDDIYEVDLERGLFVFDEAWQPMVRQVDHPQAFREVWQDSIKNRYLLPTSLDLNMLPGKYHLALEVKDRKSGSIGTYKLAMDLKGFSDGLDMSGILLASHVEPVREELRGRDDFWIVPNPLQVYDRSQMVALYFEVYGLEKDAFGQCRYQTEFSIGLLKEKGRKKRSRKPEWMISESSEATVNTSMDPRYLEIDARRLEPGVYELKLEITDLLAKRAVSRQTRFRIADGALPVALGEEE